MRYPNHIDIDIVIKLLHWIDTRNDICFHDYKFVLFEKESEKTECFWHFASHRHASHIYLPLTCLHYMLVCSLVHWELSFHYYSTTNIPSQMVEIVTKLEDTKFDGRETGSSVIGSYLQATSLFLKKIHDNLNNNHTPNGLLSSKRLLPLRLILYVWTITFIWNGNSWGRPRRFYKPWMGNLEYKKAYFDTLIMNTLDGYLLGPRNMVYILAFVMIESFCTINLLGWIEKFLVPYTLLNLSPNYLIFEFSTSIIAYC